MLLLFLALGCAHHQATDQQAIDPRVVAWIQGNSNGKPPPRECARLLPVIEQLGLVMYARDQAAWHASDAAAAELKLLAGDEPSIFEPGWLVEDGPGSNYLVEWVTSRSGAPEVIVTVEVSNPEFKVGAVQVPGLMEAFTLPDGSWRQTVDHAGILASVTSRPLSVSETSQFTALQLAIAQSVVPSGAETLNILTVQVDDAWWVYLLPATTDPDVTVMGGAVSVEVSGDLVTGVYHHGQLVYTQPKEENGMVAAAASLTIPSMGCPSETFVFSSLQYENLPIVLTDAEGIWGIRGAAITWLGPE